MKRIITAFILCFAGMTISAQGVNMSYYLNEFSLAGSSFEYRLQLLETIRDDGLTGIGEFYHEALKVLNAKFPDIKNKEERDAIEASATIVARGIREEKYGNAAADLWQAVQIYDVAMEYNQGLVMQEFLITMGEVEAKEYLPHLVRRLSDINTRVITDQESRRRVQRAVVGLIRALEMFGEPDGFRPVFLASVGWYDPNIKLIASTALPNILEDPSDIIGEIIRDNSVTPSIKYEAWREMLRSNASDSSMSKVAAIALATGWLYSTSNPIFQRDLRDMRKSAIDAIRMRGTEDLSVYIDLERSYYNNFINPVPDYDEINKAVACLGALGTDEAVNLLMKFLQELHSRRRFGPWSNRERQAFGWVVPALGATGSQSPDVRLLLLTIQRTSDYTTAEQRWAREALAQISDR